MKNSVRFVEDLPFVGVTNYDQCKTPQFVVSNKVHQNIITCTKPFQFRHLMKNVQSQEKTKKRLLHAFKKTKPKKIYKSITNAY